MIDTHVTLHHGLESRVKELIADIHYKPDYRLYVGVSNEGKIYLQVQCWRPDSITGEYDWGKGGKLHLSIHMTDQEIVQNAFGLYKAYEEHECREFFTYRGKRIYGPHISLEALLEVADRTTYRVCSDL